MFYNKSRNNNRINTLSNALSRTRRNTDSGFNNSYSGGDVLSGGIEKTDNNGGLSLSNALNGYNKYKSFAGGTGGSSGASSVPWAAIGSGAKAGYNGFIGKDDADYSDLEESVIYPLQGASVGGSYGGGWGALGGALYGLGYSFKDDLGLDDNEWYTDLIFPIGMGDEHKGLIQL